MPKTLDQIRYDIKREEKMPGFYRDQLPWEDANYLLELVDLQYEEIRRLNNMMKEKKEK